MAAPGASLTQLVAPGAERAAEAGLRRAAQAAGAVRAFRACVDEPRRGGGRGGRGSRHRRRVGRARRVRLAPAGARRLRGAGRLRHARRAAAELSGAAATPYPAPPRLCRLYQPVCMNSAGALLPMSSQMTLQTKRLASTVAPRAVQTCAVLTRHRLESCHCLGLVAAPPQHPRGRQQSRTQHQWSVHLLLAACPHGLCIDQCSEPAAAATLAEPNAAPIILMFPCIARLCSARVTC